MCRNVEMMLKNEKAKRYRCVFVGGGGGVRDRKR